MASWAGLTPLSAARRASDRASARFFSPLSPAKRGRWARKSPAPRRLAAGEETAREHAVGGRRDAELGERGEDRRLGAAADERVLDLQIADRVHLRGAADGLGADLGQADVADVAGLHHVGDRADGVLDRDGGVEARRAVDVDVIDAEARQAVREEVLGRRRAARRSPGRRRRGRAGRRT